MSTDIKAKAIEIAEKGNPLDFILNTHQSIHVGDGITAKVLVTSIGSQSVLNSEGIQPKGTGESGKGKSHSFMSMLHLVPKEYAVRTTLSDKAIFHMDIKPGSIIFSDDTVLSQRLEGTIKRATSNFQEGDIHTTLDKDHKLKELHFPGRVVWWLTSVDESQSSELINRQVGIGVDESTEQDVKVLEHQKELAEKGTIKYPETEEVLICREIIRDIKEHPYPVKIPFAKAIIWNDPGNRRNFDIFCDMIRAFAVIRHMQRKKDDKGFLIAELGDYEEAERLYLSIARTQTTKLNDTELKIIETLLTLNECDGETLQIKAGITKGRFSQIMNGKKGKTSKIGLIEKVKGLTVSKVYEQKGRRSYSKYIYKVNNPDLLKKHDSVVSLNWDIIDEYM